RRARRWVGRRRVGRARTPAPRSNGHHPRAHAALTRPQGCSRRAPRRSTGTGKRGDRSTCRPPAGECRAPRHRERSVGMSDPRPRQVVALLAGQAFAFGLSESLLLITANAIFLNAYGSKWLPLTYVAIAIVGTLLAASIARTLRLWPLPAVAL